MQPEPRLTPTSYIVLGLLRDAGEATPYELKGIAAAGVGHFWSLQHAQIYSEPARLAAAGYLSGRQEEGGRRRKRYKITAKGRKALDAWLGEPTAELNELRDPGLLRLFFGSDPARLADRQLAAHEERLAAYEGMRPVVKATGERRFIATLEAGIGHEREYIRFWKGLAP